MNDTERLQLQKMIAANGADDFTQDIRNAKHSQMIKAEVEKMMKCKKDYSRIAKSNASEFEQICLTRCNWLFMNYPDIYNRLYKDELDLRILFALLSKLREIEIGKMDQHEASFEVGKILKEMYIDSALKKEAKLEEAQKRSNKKKGIKEIKPRNLTYTDYCKMTNTDN